MTVGTIPNTNQVSNPYSTNSSPSSLQNDPEAQGRFDKVGNQLQSAQDQINQSRSEAVDTRNSQLDVPFVPIPQAQSTPAAQQPGELGTKEKNLQMVYNIMEEQKIVMMGMIGDDPNTAKGLGAVIDAIGQAQQVFVDQGAPGESHLPQNLKAARAQAQVPTSNPYDNPNAAEQKVLEEIAAKNDEIRALQQMEDSPANAQKIADIRKDLVNLQSKLFTK